RSGDARHIVPSAAYDQRAAALDKPEGIFMMHVDAPMDHYMPAASTRGRSTTEPRLIRWLLTGGVLLFLGLFLVVPLLAVFIQAFAGGLKTYLAAVTEPAAVSAIKLTLLTAVVSVVSNTVFGVVAAW